MIQKSRLVIVLAILAFLVLLIGFLVSDSGFRRGPASALREAALGGSRDASIHELDAPPVPEGRVADVGVLPVDSRAYIRGVVQCAARVVHDAVVTCTPLAPSTTGSRAVLTCTTNKEGSFFFQVEPSGTFEVTAAQDGAGTQTVIVVAGESVTIDLCDRDPFGSLVGTVVDARTAAPVAEFTVAVFLHKSDGFTSLAQKSFSTTEGRFELPLRLGRESQELSVSVSATGHSDKSIACKDVKKGARVDLGTVELDPFTGIGQGVVVREVDGRPVENCTVTPISSGGREEDEVITDNSGHFTIPRISGPKLVAMTAAANGFGTAYVTVPPDYVPTAQTPFVIRLRAEAELYGEITSVNGSKTSGVRLMYWSEDGKGVHPGIPRLISGGANSDADGEYSLKGLPASEITVALTLPMAGGKVVQAQLRRVHCEPGERKRIDFVVGQGSVVKGTLRAPGKPSNIVLVARLLDRDGLPVCVVETNVDAHIELPDVAPGAYTLRVSSTDTKFMDLPVRVSAGVTDLGDLDVSDSLRRG